MKNANLRLGLNCNNQCLFCTIANDMDRYLDFDEIKKKVDYLIHNKVSHLNITGGEPLLREDLADIICYSKEKGIDSIELQTNASKLSNINYVKKLKRAGVDSFLISLHSHRNKISNYLTNSNNFCNSVRGIKNCVKERIPVTISHVINATNYREIINFVRFIQKIDRRIGFYFSVLRPNGRTKDNLNLVPKLAEIEPYLYNLLRYCEKHNIHVSSVEGVPLCYLQDYWHLCAELIRATNGSHLYLDQTGSINKDIHGFINIKSKMKSKVCAICDVNNNCSGVWKEYAEVYGLKELYPIFNIGSHFG